MTTPQPKVSIGMPVYNAEDYLEGALRSILAQSYTDFELIISDNASTDRTEAICRAFAEKDPRVLYHRNKTNLGIAPNFNKVFHMAHGEYFKWAAHDDLLEPQFLASCVHVLDRYPDVVICYPRAKIINENGDFEVDYDPGPATDSSHDYRRFHSLMIHPEYALQQMGLIRANIMRQTVLMESFPSSDEIFLAELSLLGRYYEIPERWFIYRRYRAQLAQKLDQRSRAPFFDTSLKDKILLPTWQYLFSALKVIHRHKLGWYTKLHCYGTILQWCFMPAHARALGKDIVLAVAQNLKKWTKSFSKGSRVQESSTLK